MVIYLDVEATEQNEIISIGAVTPGGKQFYSLVKPQFSEVTPNIEQLTHITNKSLKYEPKFAEVMLQLRDWLREQEAVPVKWYFYCYGNQDANFFRQSLMAIPRTEYYSKAFSLCCQIAATITDVYPRVKEFFKGSSKLQHLHNFILQADEKQTHNALRDAVMLNDVMNFVKTHDPYAVCPLSAAPTSAKGATNKRKFDENKEIYLVYEDGVIMRSFINIKEAMKWVLRQPDMTNSDDKANQVRLWNKIVKAIKSGKKYRGFYWREKK